MKHPIKESWKTISFWAILFLGLMIFKNSSADESAGSAGTFLRMGVGARALSMGGAFVGVANDPSATFWNPAGFSQIQKIQFEFMYMNMPYDRTFNFFSGAIPIKNIMTFGLSWIGLRVSDIEGRSNNSLEPDYFFNNSQNAFYISMGKSFSPILSLGGNIKFIRNGLDNSTAMGLGFDAALLLKPTNQVSLGIMVQDIGTNIRWNNNFTEAIPLTLRFGAAWQIYKHVLFAADLQKTTNDSPKFHFGAEVRLSETLPIRIGINNQHFSGGAGLVFPLANHTLEFNYGYSNDRIANDAIHRVSVILSIGTKSKRPYNNRVLVSENQNKKKIGSIDKSKFNIIVKARVLNVRSGPGLNYSKITQVKRNQKFVAFEKQGNWVKIQLKDGKMGWVYKNYVEIIN